MQIVKKTSSGSRAIIKADYGVQSYCIVDNSIFFQCLCGKKMLPENGTAVFLKQI